MSMPSVAVLGCGYWGQNLVRNFLELGALKVVCDPMEAGRAKARQIAPEVEVSDEFEFIFQRKDIQAVVLATPAETHHALAMRAMAAGKDVLVEKPMAMNFREGAAMQAEAERTGRILMVGHLLEYHPAVLKLHELVSKGTLGKIHYLYSHRLNFGKIRIEENALWSFAPHDIAVILRLVGELPVEVTCSGGSYVTPNLADVTVSCLHFRTGLRAHIFVSWLNPFKEQQLVVVGDKQMAVFNDLLKDKKLQLYNQRVELNNRQPMLQKALPTSVEITAAEPLKMECQHFLEVVQTRLQPRTDAASGIKVLKVLEACQISMQLNGKPIVLSEIQSYSDA